MELKEFVGKIVFIKLKDGTIFSYSKVINYAENFLTIIDKFEKKQIIHESEIMRIGEEK